MADDWRNRRLEVTYEEARAVIESQNATMMDIDDKAMRTVRLNTVLIGILLAVERAIDAPIFDADWLVISVDGLLLSIILGLITYNESDLFVGPSGDYLWALAVNRTGDPWHEDLLGTFAGMISDNAEEIAWNSKLLTATQGTLSIGILAAIVAVGI